MVQIFVQAGDVTRSLEVENGSTVLDVKKFASQAEGVEQQCLTAMHNGRLLEDEQDLSEVGVLDGDVLYILGRLLGAGKKRKKKTYTKPKKIKHKHKKEKLRVLKYYKVDGDNKVERMRKLCTKATCAGIMMAAHHDRVTCGRCSLTLSYGDDK